MLIYVWPKRMTLDKLLGKLEKHVPYGAECGAAKSKGVASLQFKKKTDTYFTLASAAKWRNPYNCTCCLRARARLWAHSRFSSSSCVTARLNGNCVFFRLRSIGLLATGSGGTGGASVIHFNEHNFWGNLTVPA